jgi:hypothetical protein
VIVRYDHHHLPLVLDRLSHGGRYHFLRLGQGDGLAIQELGLACATRHQRVYEPAHQQHEHFAHPSWHGSSL